MLLKKDRSKYTQIGDLIQINESLGAVVTESWLSSEIGDAEVQLESCNIYRSDRIGRERGGWLPT